MIKMKKYNEDVIEYAGLVRISNEDADSIYQKFEKSSEFFTMPFIMWAEFEICTGYKTANKIK